MTTSFEPVERRATAGIIADLIRERIIDGTFAPGDQLGEIALAEQLGVSRGPVREALQRLIQEGLLDNRPHRGVFVIELGRKDIVDVYRARAAIEKAAASLLVERREPAAFDRLERLVEGMAAAVERNRWSRVALLDREFHETMVAAAGSKRLSRMFRTLLAETAMCIGALEPAYPRRREIVREHKELLGALRLADEASVHECVEAHLDSAVTDLEARATHRRS